MQSNDPIIRKCGCGPVAAMDTLWYLEHRGQTDSQMSLDKYNIELHALTRRYFPLIPPFGINGAFFVMKTVSKTRHGKAARLSAGNAIEELYQADARDESGVQPRDWSLFK